MKHEMCLNNQKNAELRTCTEKTGINK